MFRITPPEVGTPITAAGQLPPTLLAGENSQPTLTQAEKLTNPF